MIYQKGTNPENLTAQNGANQVAPLLTIKKMKNYTVFISAMASHITDKSHRNESFVDYNKAFTYFTELCDDNNIDCDTFEGVEMEYEAGGIGYDYRVELIINKI